MDDSLLEVSTAEAYSVTSLSESYSLSLGTRNNLESVCSCLVVALAAPWVCTSASLSFQTASAPASLVSMAWRDAAVWTWL